MSKSKREQKQERVEALEYLRKLIKPGDVIYTKLAHVSRSGMYRAIDLYVIRENEPLRISWSAGTLLEGYDTRHEACRASGCGMDMGFHLVYNLSRTLFSGGWDCLGKEARCPSNDHNNFYSQRRDATRPIKDPYNQRHEDGGYALTHRWL